MVAKVCNAITTVLLIVLLALAVVLVGPNLLGYRNLMVLSGSMEPQIPVGAMVTVDPRVELTEVLAGDVITYQLNQDTLSTHRVVENNVTERSFVTKGDANQDIDLVPVVYERVVGKVLYSIPYLGRLIGLIQSRQGILIIAGVLLAVILLTFLPIIFAPEQSASKKGKGGRLSLKEAPVKPELYRMEAILGKRKKPKKGEEPELLQERSWYY